MSAIATTTVIVITIGTDRLRKNTENTEQYAVPTGENPNEFHSRFQA
jgi:hypothetical protein